VVADEFEEILEAEEEDHELHPDRDLTFEGESDTDMEQEE